MRILLISASFPPIGGMTPLQAGYFARHLAARGHAVDVLTMRPGAHHPRYKLDPQTSALVPPTVTVHRTYAGPIHHLARHFVPDGTHLADSRTSGDRRAKVDFRQRVAQWARPLLIPDSRVDWLPWAFVTGLRLLRSQRYDVLFSIAPPDTDNLIGYALSRLSGLPWVVHQGDLWSFGPLTDGQGLPRWRRALDGALEERLLQRMDKVIVLTPEMRDLYLGQFPSLTEDKFALATVGYDAEEYGCIAPEVPGAGTFRIVYTGIFYPGIRDPDRFLEAMAEFARGRQDVELVIAGNMGTYYQRRAEELGIGPVTTLLGHQPHHRVVALQKGASVLLLLCWVGGYGFAAKTVEYLASRRPIVAVDYDGRDPAARAVRALQRGLVVPNDRAALHAALERLYTLWKHGQLESSFALEEVPEFTWEAVVDRVEETLRAACRSPAGHGPLPAETS